MAYNPNDPHAAQLPSPPPPGVPPGKPGHIQVVIGWPGGEVVNIPEDQANAFQITFQGQTGHHIGEDKLGRWIYRSSRTEEQR